MTKLPTAALLAAFLAPAAFAFGQGILSSDPLPVLPGGASPGPVPSSPAGGGRGQTRGGGGSGTLNVNGVTRSFITDANGNRIFLDAPPLASFQTPDGYRIRVTDFSVVRNLEKGSSQPSSLTVAIDSPQPHAPELMLRHTRITKALDERGSPLTPLEPAGNALYGVGTGTSPLSGGPPSGRGGPVRPATTEQPISGMIPVAPFPRNAAGVRLVEGQLELFLPSLQSSATLANYLGAAGKPLVSEALARQGIEITVVTPELWSAFRSRLGDLGRAPSMPGPSNVALLVDDPRSMLGGIAFRRPGSDTPQTVSASGMHAGTTAIYLLQGLPKADLIVYFATPETLTSIPFHLENISFQTP